MSNQTTSHPEDAQYISCSPSLFDSYQDKENVYQDSCFSSFVVKTNTMAKEICKRTDFFTILFQDIHNLFS